MKPHHKRTSVSVSTGEGVYRPQPAYCRFCAKPLRRVTGCFGKSCGICLRPLDDIFVESVLGHLVCTKDGTCTPSSCDYHVCKDCVFGATARSRRDTRGECVVSTVTSAGGFCDRCGERVPPDFVLCEHCRTTAAPNVLVWERTTTTTTRTSTTTSTTVHCLECDFTEQVKPNEEVELRCFADGCEGHIKTVYLGAPRPARQTEDVSSSSSFVPQVTVEEVIPSKVTSAGRGLSKNKSAKKNVTRSKAGKKK